MNLESESLTYQNLMKNEGVGIIIWDRNKELAKINKKAQEITDGQFTLGLSWFDVLIGQLQEKKFIGESMEKKLTPELRKLWEQGKEIQSDDIKSIKKWAQEYGTARLAQSGVPTEQKNKLDEWFYVIDLKFEDGSFISMLTDITPLKDKEKKGEEFKDAIDEIPFIVDLWDKDDKLIYANKNSIDMWRKLDHNWELGKSFKELIRSSKKNYYKYKSR